MIKKEARIFRAFLFNVFIIFQAFFKYFLPIIQPRKVNKRPIERENKAANGSSVMAPKLRAEPKTLIISRVKNPFILFSQRSQEIL